MRRRCVTIAVVVVFGAMPLLADVEFTVNSEPAGATVTAAGRAYGTTPVMVKVPTKRKSPCFAAAAMTITWASGASVSTPEGMPICQGDGKRQMMSVARPAGAAGADLDYQYAVQVQQLDLLRRQMLVDAYLGIAQQRQAAYEAEQRRVAETARRIQGFGGRAQSGLQCTADRLGDRVYARCQ